MSPHVGGMLIYVAGFLLSPEQIGHLCIKGYGLSEGLVNNRDSPVDAAWHQFYVYKTQNPTGLIPMFRKNSHLLDEDLEGFILTCRVAFIRPGLKEPDLSLDKASTACADFWFPPFLRGMDEFKGVRYVQYRVPMRLGCRTFFFSWTASSLQIRSHHVSTQLHN
ncbi:uncharacterized protein BXZ73DRAFT_80747 [Epithele typhae]|uniref:uncharacterized protein n=1 Tax=Epithele typhae TaxID=378194 RepID=UPI002008523A|nr:uncharacterized protein BXZ73DRAFT_80747 [Epithele typhae]KAH9917912.1 hypothetical protein BXZ73DRAFT_80747 [Epithele typhae]